MLIRMKKRLSEHEEFEIMKLILDKFLWIGFIIMAFGAYQMAAVDFANGLMWFGAGIVFLILFIILMVKEYEVIR